MICNSNLGAPSLFVERMFSPTEIFRQIMSFNYFVPFELEDNILVNRWESASAKALLDNVDVSDFKSSQNFNLSTQFFRFKRWSIGFPHLWFPILNQRIWKFECFNGIVKRLQKPLNVSGIKCVIIAIDYLFFRLCGNSHSRFPDDEYQNRFFL